MSNNNVRKTRKAQSKSLMALAHKIGSTPSWITFIERYGHVPGPDLRQRLADALGVTEDELWPELSQNPVDETG